MALCLCWGAPSPMLLEASTTTKDQALLPPPCPAHSMVVVLWWMLQKALEKIASEMDALYFDDHMLKRLQSLKSESSRDLGLGSGSGSGGGAHAPTDAWPLTPSAPFIDEEEVIGGEGAETASPVRSSSMDMSTMFEQLRLDGDLVKRSNSEGRYPTLRQPEPPVKKPAPPPPVSETTPAAPFAPPR